MSDFFSVEHPIRFAHRGSSILWPENTMFAFNAAVEQHDYRYLELDVHLSADRVPMVLHDSKLDRTTDGSGPIAARDMVALKQLDAAYLFDSEHDYPMRDTGITIPTLDEVYRAWPEARVNIDLKTSGEEWAVAEVIRANDAEHRTMVGSFVDGRISRFRRITGGTVAVSAGPRTAIKLWASSRFGMTRRLPVQAYQVSDSYTGFSVDRRFVAAVHRAGAQIHVWTVNEASEMKRLLGMGVDGIITDRPDLLNEVLDS
ncbi:MAG: glycerophosphodiester phosphodiesterase [Acidimicrobiia bacterium]|nr:MAG: glycerophosphodiester phosphodiesterase [Acidimicrobiia bacterium]